MNQPDPTFPHSWWPWPDRELVYRHLTSLWAYVVAQTEATTEALTRMEDRMSKNSDALAELDAQIDELEAYVLSDDETDAAEVQQRVARLKSVLAAAKASAEEPSAEGGEVPSADQSA